MRVFDFERFFSKHLGKTKERSGPTPESNQNPIDDPFVRLVEDYEGAECSELKSLLFLNLVNGLQMLNAERKRDKEVLESKVSHWRAWCIVSWASVGIGLILRLVFG